MGTNVAAPTSATKANACIGLQSVRLMAWLPFIENAQQRLTTPSSATPVRCSAWLGVRSDAGETCNKNLESLGLAENDRITRDKKLAPAERMQATKDQSRRPVEHGGRTGGEKVALAGVMAKPRGSSAALAADVARKACNGGHVRNSKQPGERRRIG